MSNRGRIALRTGAVLLLAALASGCPLLHPQKPNVTLKKVDVTNVDFAGAKLTAVLDVENRLPASITTARSTWSVSIDGNKLASGEFAQGLSLPASVHTPVSVPFELKFQDLWRIAEKYKDQDTAPYRFEGSLGLDTPIGPIDIPFHYDGTVPVLRIPEVDLARVDVRGVNFTGADVRFGFHVRNPNAQGITVQSLDYAVTLAGARLANGKIPSGLDLQPKSTGNFEADIHVSFMDAAQAARSLASSNSADYTVGGSLSAKTPWGVVTSPYSKSGTVKIQR